MQECRAVGTSPALLETISLKSYSLIGMIKRCGDYAVSAANRSNNNGTSSLPIIFSRCLGGR